MTRARPTGCARACPAVAALCAVAVLATSGCATLRGGAVPETTPCAQAVPVAVQRAGRHARLVAVRALSRRRAQAVIDARVLRAADGAVYAGRARGRSCLLVFRGRFAPAGGGAAHRLLVLLVHVRPPTVLATLATDALPRAVRRAM